MKKKLRQFKAYCKKLKLEAEEANKKMFLMFGNCTVECEYAKQLKAENERLRGEVAEYAQVNADLHKDNLSLFEKAELWDERKHLEVQCPRCGNECCIEDMVKKTSLMFICPDCAEGLGKEDLSL